MGHGAEAVVLRIHGCCSHGVMQQWFSCSIEYWEGRGTKIKQEEAGPHFLFLGGIASGERKASGVTDGEGG